MGTINITRSASVNLDKEELSILQKAKGILLDLRHEMFLQDDDSEIYWMLDSAVDCFEELGVKSQIPEEEKESRCWYCGGRLCWDSDYNYDEVYGEGEGIVSFLHCVDCGAEVEFSLKEETE